MSQTRLSFTRRRLLFRALQFIYLVLWSHFSLHNYFGWNLLCLEVFFWRFHVSTYQQIRRVFWIKFGQFCKFFGIFTWAKSRYNSWREIICVGFCFLGALIWHRHTIWRILFNKHFRWTVLKNGFLFSNLYWKFNKLGQFSFVKV